MNGLHENSLVNSQEGIKGSCEGENSILPILDKHGMATNYCTCSLLVFGRSFFITLATIICIVLAATLVIILSWSRQIINHIRMRKAHADNRRIGTGQAQTS